MSRLFYHVMQDTLGNLLFNVEGTMRIAGTGTLAGIYGDEALTVPLGNPMSNHPSFGSFKCYLGPGTYDFYMGKAGYAFETLTGLQGTGTMANQNATAVAITGGTVQVSTVEANVNVSIAEAVQADRRLGITYARSTQNGVVIRPTQDTGNFAILFSNAASAAVGSISTTGAATAFNTTSDARLKTMVDDLTGELGLIQALRPVSFRWLADDTPGVGFLAHEVAQVVPGVVTGDPEAVDDAGGILPQMMDYSKLVPYLVAAVKELTQQVERLAAQLAGASTPASRPQS